MILGIIFVCLVSIFVFVVAYISVRVESVRRKKGEIDIECYLESQAWMETKRQIEVGGLQQTKTTRQSVMWDCSQHNMFG